MGLDSITFLNKLPGFQNWTTPFQADKFPEVSKF